MSSALSSFNTTTEVPLSKAPNPQLLPGRRSINGCPLLWVCVQGVCVHCCVCTLDGLIAEHKFRVWVTILGRMSLHFTYKQLKQKVTFWEVTDKIELCHVNKSPSTLEPPVSQTRLSPRLKCMSDWAVSTKKLALTDLKYISAFVLSQDAQQ